MPESDAGGAGPYANGRNAPDPGRPVAPPRALVIAWRFLCLALRIARAHRRSPATAAAALRDTLASLGATFVKLGQALSQRVELLPPPYPQTLAALQDRVPPFPAATARATIEAAFGRPIAELFAQFDDTPLAAASVAQVHRATLRDGTVVVVKVRRPNLRVEVEHDLRWLRRTVRIAALLWPAFARWRPLSLVDELAARLRREIDLRAEAANMRRMRYVLAGVAGVHMPDVVEPLVHEEALVQTFSVGRPIATAFATEQGRHFAGVLLDAFLHQLFRAGFFHGDPHPGNVFVQPDGSLCLHDFGVIGFLDQRSRSALAQLLHAVAARDARSAMEASVELGLIDAAPERPDVVAAVDEILAELATQPLSDWSPAEVLLRIARLDPEHHLLLPRNLLLLTRTLMLLEGLTRALDPGFALISELEARAPQVADMLLPVASIAVTPEAVLQAARHVPALLLHWLRELEQERGPAAAPRDRPGHAGMTGDADRIAAALVALGLYVVAAALLLARERLALPGGWPVPALLALALALILSWRVVRGAGPGR